MMSWLNQRRSESILKTARIPFAQSREWCVTDGRLVHASGGFFAVEGLRCKALNPALDGLQQPIINQPEIGVLGFLVKEYGASFRWLLQAKNEPGNIGAVQLAPTVQATYSNFTQLHGGAPTHYIGYFLGNSVLESDSLQSEQGTRFLGKFNRNAVCRVQADVKPATDNFAWATSRELRDALLADYCLNTDARSVIVSSPWRLIGQEGTPFGGPGATTLFGDRLSVSYAAPQKEGQVRDIEGRIEALRGALALSLETCSLDALRGWCFDGDHVGAAHPAGDLTVEHYAVEASDRERPMWDQPLVRSASEDLVVLFCQRRDGVLRFLMRPAIEPGLTGGAELGPSFKKESAEFAPDWLNAMVDDNAGSWCLEVAQSDEGGRFMESRCRYCIAELDAGTQVPDDPWNIWVTLAELEGLCRAPKLLTNEARSVVSVLLGLA